MGTFVVYESATYDKSDAGKLSASRERGMRKLGAKLKAKLQRGDLSAKKAIRLSFKSIVQRVTAGTGCKRWLVKYLTDVHEDEHEPVVEWDVSLPDAHGDDDDEEPLTYVLSSASGETGTVQLVIRKDSLADGTHDFKMNIAVPRNASVESDFAYLDTVVEDLRGPMINKRDYLLGLTTFSRCR